MRIIVFIITLFMPYVLYAFPVHPITIYVPFVVGGTSEKLAQAVASQIFEDTNIKFIVKTNDTGLSATDYINSLKSLPNDGHHLVFGNVGTHASNIALNEKAVLYDPIHDFIPIALLGKTPLLVALRSNFPANNLQEFLKYMRKNPIPKITLAHSGYGSTSYLAGIYFSSILKIDPILVPYNGSSYALKDMANGYIDIMINQTTSTLSYIQGNLIKGVMTTAENRTSMLPDIPTSAEVGLPEFNIHGWNMVFAPKGTSRQKIQFLNQLFVNSLENKFIKSKFKLSNTLLIPREQNNISTLRHFVRSQMSYWQDVITIFKNKNVIKEIE